MIDFSTDVGKLRLRVSDLSDIPFLPDSVYLQTLTDTDNNLPLSAKTCATYILGMLAFKTHRRMSLQLEVWGGEAFSQYKEFLLLTVKDPSFFDITPLPISSLTEGNRNILAEFVSDWSRNYYSGTQSQSMALTADISPNDGSREGPLGSTTTSGLLPGWVVT